MPRISGMLNHVTGDPDSVTSIGVAAVKVRPGKGGIITSSPKIFKVENGQVSFPCEPGEAVLTLHYLNSAVEAVPIVVGESPKTQSLSAVVQAALSVMGKSREELEKVVTGIGSILANAETVEKITREAKEAAQQAQDAAELAQSAAGPAEAVKWMRGRIEPKDKTLKTADTGFSEVWTVSNARALGLPVAASGVLETFRIGNITQQRFSCVEKGEIQLWITQYVGNEKPVWRRTTWILGRVTEFNANDLPDGVVTLWSGADCAAIGLPESGQGFVTTVTWGNPGYEVRLQVAEIVDAGKFKTYRRYFYKGAWKEWVDEASKHANSTPARSGAPAAGLKTVPVSLSLGNMPNGNRPSTGSYRNKFLFNVPIFRWRVCMSAQNPRFGTTNNSDVKVTRVTFGEHAGNGKFAATPRTIATNLILGRDGSVAKSDWQTGGIEKNKEFLLGYDYTGNAETLGLVGSCWKTTSGSSTDVAPQLSTDWLTPLDIWLEVETYAGTPVVAAFGDSLTCGVGNTWSVFDSWLSKYCRDNEALPVHYAASGDNAKSWASDFKQYKWTRWDEHATPDAVIYALGSNDIASSTLDEIKTNTLAVVGEIQRKWSTSLYAVNLTPRNTWINQPGDEVRKQYNQWLKAQPWPRQVFDFSTVVIDTATGGIKESYNGDNVHLNTAGYAAEAASITPPVTAPPVLYKNK